MYATVCARARCFKYNLRQSLQSVRIFSSRTVHRLCVLRTTCQRGGVALLAPVCGHFGQCGGLVSMESWALYDLVTMTGSCSYPDNKGQQHQCPSAPPYTRSAAQRSHRRLKQSPCSAPLKAWRYIASNNANVFDLGIHDMYPSSRFLRDSLDKEQHFTAPCVHFGKAGLAEFIYLYKVS